MNTATVTPILDFDAAWVKHQLAALDYILATGKDRPDNEYVNGKCKRAWGLVSMVLCCGTVCGPCIAWDSMCVMLKCCIGCRSECYGMGCMCLAASVDELYKKHGGRNCNTIVMMRSSVTKVGNQYLAKFDECLAQKTEEGAKRANLIRARLVEILKVTLDAKLVDTGDISVLRKLVVG